MTMMMMMMIGNNSSNSNSRRLSFALSLSSFFVYKYINTCKLSSSRPLIIIIIDKRAK